MALNLQTILIDHPQLFNLVQSSEQSVFSKVSTPESSEHNSISFISQDSHIKLLNKIKSTLWIIPENYWSGHSALILEQATLTHPSILTCVNLQLAMAHILKYFDRKKELLSYQGGISPQSLIHPTAEISSGVTIGPFCCIGPNVIIDSNTIIGPNCTIEGNSRIGKNSILESHVFIGNQTKIGDHCRIKGFACIGSDGFGYAKSHNGPLNIPQIGFVVIEDFVDIGANTCIDRATISVTRIGRGTKIDNLVHIAHNCDIGQYCFLTAGFGIAGSSKIGDYFMTGGHSAVADHVTISEKVILAGASIVTSNITEPGSYGGNPVQPMNDYLRTRSSMIEVPKLRKQVNKLIKHLGLLRND